MSKAKKRFFECVHCKKRKITLNERFPKTTCGKCGKNEFKAVGMMKMKADKVGSECFNEKIHELTEQY